MNDENLKWTEKSSKELLKTVVFDVTSRHSVSADGLEGDYIVVNARDWAIVIPEDGDDFLMVKQWRHGEGKLSIEFPGGVIDDGETPDEASVRELKEETGIIARELKEIGRVVSNENHSIYVEFLYVTNIDKNNITLQEGETQDFKWVNKEELIKMNSNILVTKRMQLFLEDFCK